MKYIVITNNPMVRDGVSDDIIEYTEADYIGVLKIVRDRIHLGHRLITHPLAGSVKPGETPYRTVLISKEKGALDEKALFMIEESIETCMKFKAERKYSEKVLMDFQLIDFSLVFGNK